MPPCADLAPPSPAGMSMRELDLLARTHAARLASFLRRRIGNPQDVEDLVQDTLLEAMRCLTRFQGQSRPETWLFGIAVNLVRNHYKRAKVRDICTDADTDEIPSDRADDPAEIAEHRERMAHVAAAVRDLPEESRQLLQYVVQDDLTYQEVAQQLGIPIGTVRSRISRARSFLRQRAEGDHAVPRRHASSLRAADPRTGLSGLARAAA